MSVETRACPSCTASLAIDAAFCHKCGTPTPQEINRETGEMKVASGMIDAMQMTRLQRALGDSCEVRRLLGRGGFAEVYVAYDKRLKREVAVKTIRSDVLASSALRERFQREAEAVAKLRHPNVVPIYSVGEDEELAYFTMPLIVGDSIAGLLEKEGKLSIAEVCRILRESANALHAAHRAGIVHRDIKPENIMIEGAERSAVVMDFGIAKSTGSDSQGLTGTGMMMGTPQYMSPEQATGEGELDHHSDQYSLAMVGYRMLLGRLPFEANSLQSQIFKAVTEVPAPLASLDPEIPTSVSDAIAKALSKRPHDRFESMTALAAALEPPVVVAAGASTLRRVEPKIATRVARMHEEIAGIPRVLVVLGLLALIAFVVLRIRNAPPPVLALAAAKENAVFAARQFLSARAPDAQPKAYPILAVDDGLAYRFLIQQVGYDSLLRRAVNDIPVWQWVVRLPSADRRDNWVVTIGPQNRVTAYHHVVNDSAALPTIPVDSARVLADSEFAKRGWTADVSIAKPDSVTVRKGRTDYQFTRQRSSGSISWLGNDSATFRARVDVTGDRISSFLEHEHEPEAFSETLRKPPQWLNGVIGLVVFGLAVGIIALVVHRQRVDEFQWSAIARLAGVSILIYVMSELPDQLRKHATVSAWSSDASWTGLLVQLFIFTFLALVIVFVGAGAESIAQESRPTAVRGLLDVSRGRLVIPEIVPAVIAGLTGGALFVCIGELATFVERRWFAESAVAPSFQDVYGGVPALEQLGDVALSTVFLPLLALFVAVVCARWRRLSHVLTFAIASALFALLVGAESGLVDAAQAFILFLLILTGLWYFGLLAGMIAFMVQETLPNAVTLLQTDQSGYRLGGVFLLAIVLSPAAVAWLAYRRFDRAPSTTSA